MCFSSERHELRAKIWAHSSNGRALPLQGRGQGFEFLILHQNLVPLLWKSSEPARDSPANVDWHKTADEDLCSAAMSEGVRAYTRVRG